MARAFFPVYFSSRQTLNALDDEQRGRVMMALLDYSERGENPQELVQAERVAFDTMRYWIDRLYGEYDGRKKTSPRNGLLGGRPPKSEYVDPSEKPKNLNNLISPKAKAKAKAKAKEGVREESVENDDGSLSLPRRFFPPSVDQVADYCAGRSNGIDAQHFVDYYEARGWMIGKQRMRSWQAAIRNWENRNAQQNRNTIDSQFDRVLGAAINDEEDGDDDDKA